MPQRDILKRDRHLRGITTRHHSAALARLAGPTLLEQAKHLSLAYGRTLIPESEEEMTLIFDLAVHTAKPGRSMGNRDGQRSLSDIQSNVMAADRWRA